MIFIAKIPSNEDPIKSVEVSLLIYPINRNPNERFDSKLELFPSAKSHAGPQQPQHLLQSDELDPSRIYEVLGLRIAQDLSRSLLTTLKSF